MTEKRERKVTQSGLTREYKATTQLEAEAASLNWVAALVTAIVVLAGAGLNRLIEGTWQQWNIYIIIGTALVASICFWMVWDAKKAILEVENFYLAIILSAQTALRDIIGTHQLSELLTHREKLGRRLQEILDEKTNPWGVTVQSVEIRDIILPKDLEDAMSKEAQAERERHARVILGTAETEIAEKFVQAARQYESNPGAMHLRGMNMLFEGLKEKGSLIIVPSSALETMNLGAIGGMAALSQVKSEKNHHESDDD